jgi:hypothetical protein
MKKHLLLICTFLLSGLAGFSQIEFDNDTINKTGAAGEFEIIVYNNVTNNSSDTAFRWKRLKNTFNNNKWTSAFCDNNLCYGVDTDSADFVLKQGESFEMSAHFYPDGSEGCGSALIAIYSVNDPSNRTVARFQAETMNSTNCLATLDVKQVKKSELAIAPNPANQFIRISLPGSTNLKVAVYDLLGKKVIDASTEGSNNTVDVSKLVKGVYIVQVTTPDGQKIAKTFRKVN